jgi:hypothetical protein
MGGVRGEGAIIDIGARRVRLRHEPRGYVYELRGDEAALEVVRADTLTGKEEAYGRIHCVRGRWKPEECLDRGKADALALVARAWNAVPHLRRRSVE